MQNRLFLPFSFFRKPKKLQCCKWAPLSLKKENQSRKGKRRESILFWLLSALAWREGRNFVFSQNLFLCQRPKHLPKHFVSKNCILFSTSQKGSKFLWGNFFSLWDLVNYEPGRYRPPFLPPKNKHTQRGRLGSGMTTLTWPNPPFPSFLPTFYIKYPFSRPFFAKREGEGRNFCAQKFAFLPQAKTEGWKIANINVGRFFVCLTSSNVGTTRNAADHFFASFSRWKNLVALCLSQSWGWLRSLLRQASLYIRASYLRKFYHNSKAEMLWTRIFSFDVMDWFDWTLGF